MRTKCISILAIVVLLSSGSPLIVAQTLAPDFERINKKVVDHIQKTRPDWAHEIVPALTPPGVKFNQYVVIHNWYSDKCITAEVIIDGVSSGQHPVSCRIKLVIDRSESEISARTRLDSFIYGHRNGTAMAIGDKGYGWNGSDVIFIKGKFMFQLSGGLNLRVGDFTNNKEYMEKLAKEIDDAAN